MVRPIAQAAAGAPGPAGEPEDPACTCTTARPASPGALSPLATRTEAITFLHDLIRREAQPALGCTEPVMVALAAARAAHLAHLEPSASDLTIIVHASAPILKNGRSVGLPGTTQRGLDTAAALGALAGRHDLGLRVLEPVTREQVAAARRLIDAGRVTVALEPDRSDLYVRAVVAASGHRAEVTFEGSHTNCTREVVDRAGRAPAGATDQNATQSAVTYARPHSNRRPNSAGISATERPGTWNSGAGLWPGNAERLPQAYQRPPSQPVGRR